MGATNAVVAVRSDLWRTWAPVLAGTALLYLPTYLDLYRVFWRAEHGAHGPVILLMVAWLVWRERDGLHRSHAGERQMLGAALLGFGLLLYVLGRSQSIHQLEVGSQIPVFAGIVCLLLGTQGLRRFWFHILLLVFLVPIPGSILDQLLLPLKGWVSGVVDTTLHAMGYPIARNGVVLIIGPYSLLIADACSGLNSMVALAGIGLLYTYVAGHSNRWLNTALLLSILPIAFAANIARVMILVLITYYEGDTAGQAFHDHAGLLEIALAFGGFFVFDHLMLKLSARSTPSKPRPTAVRQLS
jgi:exosortase B